MTSEDVSKIIADEIKSAGNSRLGNSHGLDFSRCLIKPVRVPCTNTFPAFRNGKSFEAWLVLEELPGKDEGYRIIFDEELRKFGLACGTSGRPVFIGWHGSFLNTVQGM